MKKKNSKMINIINRKEYLIVQNSHHEYQIPMVLDANPKFYVFSLIRQKKFCNKIGNYHILLLTPCLIERKKVGKERKFQKISNFYLTKVNPNLKISFLSSHFLPNQTKFKG